MDKRNKFSEQKLVDSYDDKRFGGLSGRYVDVREKGIMVDYLREADGRILDIACGTARYAKLISSLGKGVVAADYSLEMLKRAKMASGSIDFVRCDALMLPFREGVFGGVLAGRLLQHYRHIAPILREMGRVTKKDMYVVFDILRWSPRQLFALCREDDVRAVYPHKEKEIKNISKELKLEIEKRESIFLFAPAVYRYLPFYFVRFLDFIEKKTAPSCRVRDFYKLRRLS